MAETERLQSIARALDALRELAIEREREHADELASIPAALQPSARNLAHYLALRSLDLRPLQEQLAELGLSSLGRSEGDVLGVLEAVRAVVRRLAGEDVQLATADLAGARHRLAGHATTLLGPAPLGRPARVMVTLPSSAASDVASAQALVAAGVELVRINCAHDGPEQWIAMAANIRAAARACGREVRIQADLAGPKLRTGTVLARRDVLRFRPQRDGFGTVIEPATIALRAIGAPGTGVPIPGELLAQLRDHDVLRLADARGRQRRLTIERRADGCVARSDRTSYLVPGLEVEARHRGERIGRFAIADDLVGEGMPLVAGESFLLVDEGEVRARPHERAVVGCLAPDVLRHVRAGERILFDDGKLAGVVERHQDDGVLVRIERTRPGGATLRSDRGINLPETELHLPLPNDRDVFALRAVVEHVDMIGLSFVHEPEEVTRVRRLVAEAGRPELGLVLKIETRVAFERLPQLLLAALRNMPAGVMVARGDLAVEVGFERLAEVQEEILWLCEAAHVPCIWATQVLDTLARTGQPSRAEVTDAAMGARAECVMLNKGPFLLEAVRSLMDVLRRMETHQTKKRSLLRRLSISAPPQDDDDG